MRSFVRLLSAFVLLLAAAEASFAACGDNPGDAQAVAATRAQIAQQCPCSGFRSHGAYQRCASGVTNQAVQAGTLSKACAEVVNNCAGNSTCGTRAAVTCCRTDATGATTCSVKSRASACTAPSGGSACVGTQPSCCDACVSGGCAGGGGTTTTTVPPSTTTTTTSATTSSTTTPVGTCAPIVPSAAIANTYRLNGTTGEKRCTTNSAANRFGTCTTDADCGSTAGACLQLPWVTADGQVMPFATGVQTNFTVTPGTFPTCEHSACVPCGNPHASCAGVPGCEVAGNPNGCVPRGTQGCCDQPGFIVPTFFVNILGGLCSRVDQIDCGVGVVNTSNPQTGDNDVIKMADTSDPGPDCIYGTTDDPPHKLCTATGEGNDLNGKIVSTIGNNSPDTNGTQFRLSTPELSTTWTDSQSPPGTCANGSTYDDGELLVSQIVLKAEPTSAGASGAFGDMNGDGCRRAGSRSEERRVGKEGGPRRWRGGANRQLRQRREH